MDIARTIRRNLPRDFIFSVFFASLIVVISHCAATVFDAVDALTLTAASKFNSTNYRRIDTEPKLIEVGNSQYRVTQVMITDNDFESGIFNRHSPLNRNSLKIGIDNIIKNLQPDILAIDLDLSPNSKDQAKTPIDQILIEASDKTKIVLITPTKLKRNFKIAQKNLQWMKSLCHSNIEFASPTIHSFLGTVSKYKSEKNQYCSLGQEIFSLTDNSTREPACKDVCVSVRGEKPGAVNVFSLVFDFTNKEKDKPYKTNYCPIDFSFIDRHIFETTSFGKYNSPPNEIETRNNRNLAKEKHIVILGGNYGETDQYLTPVGMQSGVTVHTGIFYALTNSTTQISSYDKVVSYCIDIIFGVIIAVLFNLAREIHNITLDRESPKTAFEPLLSILFYMLPILFFCALLLLSGWVLQFFHLWIHPHLIALGAFLEVYGERSTGTNKITRMRKLIKTKDEDKLKEIPWLLAALNKIKEKKTGIACSVIPDYFPIDTKSLAIRTVIWATVFMGTVLSAWIIIIIDINKINPLCSLY